MHFVGKLMVGEGGGASKTRVFLHELIQKHQMTKYRPSQKNSTLLNATEVSHYISAIPK